MTSRLSCSLLAALFLTATVGATGTVTLTLTSSVAGHSVAPGATVDWTIAASVSTGDNLGLALLACDLFQDANNPAKLDLPPGNVASIPAAMVGFNRPGGITNPGEGGAASGYIGVQRGTAGQKNLIQIGGGQNTFGQAGTGGIGTDSNVDPGVGQPGPQTILSGSFVAPSATGTYTYRLQGAVANVLTQIHAPPQFSTVSQATVNLAGASFTFTVGAANCPGDCNCDGVINFDDINAFVDALGGGTPCNFTNCDIDGNGQITFDDINPFVSILSSGATCP